MFLGLTQALHLEEPKSLLMLGGKHMGVGRLACLGP